MCALCVEMFQTKKKKKSLMYGPGHMLSARKNAHTKEPKKLQQIQKLGSNI